MARWNGAFGSNKFEDTGPCIMNNDHTNSGHGQTINLSSHRLAKLNIQLIGTPQVGSVLRFHRTEFHQSGPSTRQISLSQLPFWGSSSCEVATNLTKHMHHYKITKGNGKSCSVNGYMIYRSIVSWFTT